MRFTDYLEILTIHAIPVLHYHEKLWDDDDRKSCYPGKQTDCIYL